MIKEISFKQQGPYHKAKGIVCQDSFFSIHKDSYVIAAVADGLGSEKFSDVGSSIASRVAVEYCAEHYESEMNIADIQKIMNNAFVYGWKAVCEKAVEDGNSFDEYDTTLCLVIYNGKSIYYGQSGDSGMIALGEDGYYKVITEKQRDDAGCVFPLCFGPDHWKFGKEKGPFHSVMLMTDGIFEQMMPPILNKDNSGKYKLNILNLERVMNRTENDDKVINEVQTQLFEYFENYPSYALDDDKTVLVLWNTDTECIKLNDEYYAPIDWNEIYGQVNDRINSDYDISTDDSTKEESADERDQNLSEELNNIVQIQEIENDDSANEQNTDDKVSVDNSQTMKSSKLQKVKKKIYQTIPIIANSKLSLIIIIAFSILMCIASSFFREHKITSALGVMIACFISNASVLLPSASLITIVQAATIVNPFVIGVFGGIGCAGGEMVSYIFGNLASKRLSNSKVKRILLLIEPYFLKHPYLLILAFSALPFPVFDLVGILAGIYKLDIKKYFFVCLLGKTVKCCIFALVANAVTSLIS